ncbi:MAG: BACON domain-containing carbohydrate-binding protein, partial [Vicinamibacterales bacterium]
MFRGAKIYCVVLAGLLGVWPSQAAAQATVNPTRALFNASADHSATDGGGTSLVQSYEIGLYILGASQPFQTVSIGKPTPDGTGTITVDMTSAFLGWPIVGTNYTADVAAVGPGGVARSTLSNTFSFTGGGGCSFNVSPTSPSVPATSGSYTTTVATTSGCAWTGISNNTSWITVTGGSTGTGNGTVSYTVAANTSTTPRTGTLTIAGVTVTVTQAGACAYTIAPTTQSVLAAGGSHSATVTTTATCGWTGVSNNTTWIT